jgi:hypothetical protein
VAHPHILLTGRITSFGIEIRKQEFRNADQAILFAMEGT